MIDFNNPIDISWPVSPSMTAYKNQSTVTFTPMNMFETHGSRKTTIQLSTHDGTHIDAPSHFIDKGLTTSQLPLNHFIGLCHVFDLSVIEQAISIKHLEKLDIQPNSIVIFKTKNSYADPNALFDHSFIYIDASAAQFLVSKKIKSVGIDYLGIERQQPNHETHTTFFVNGIGIIEGLRLADVISGNYFLCCLPLKIENLDGAPARAVLFTLLND